jgi:hypothetical protein
LLGFAKAAKVAKLGCLPFFGFLPLLWHVFGKFTYVKIATMKKIMGLALLAIPLILLSFKPAYNIDDVVAAIRAGDAAGLAKFFDERVDISLPDKTDTYSKTQAEMIMRDFFTNKGVLSFEVKHKGEQGGAQFCVGELKTKQGSFRTHLFMRQRGDRQLLQEIRFQAVQ